MAAYDLVLGRISKTAAPPRPGTAARPSPPPPTWPPSSAASSSPPDLRQLALTSRHPRKCAPSAWPGTPQRHNCEKSRRQAVARHAMRRLLGAESLSVLDPESLFYLTWRWAYLTASVPADEAYKLEKAFDVDLGHLCRPRGFARQSSSSFTLLGPQDRRGLKPLPLTSGTYDRLRELPGSRHRPRGGEPAGQVKDSINGCWRSEALILEYQIYLNILASFTEYRCAYWLIAPRQYT